MKTRMEILRRIAVIIIACICSLPPTLAQNEKDIVDRLETSLGVSLPSPYKAKFKEFVATNKIMCFEESNAFTEKFIKDQMKNNLGINRQNQFLLVWNAIYHAIKNDYIYDGSDGNKTILDDYEKVCDAIDDCEAKYKKDYIAYMKQLKAEADRRIVEADRRTAEALKNIMHTDSIWIINHMEKFYDTYKEYPSTVRQSDLDFMREAASEIVSSCKKYGIDYKAILRKEVGDEKKVKDILKFYKLE